MSTKNNKKKNKLVKTRLYKGPGVFDREMRIKFGAISFLVMAALVFLIGVLIVKHNVDGDDYAITVLEQQNYSSSVIPYKRGDIVDRNGVVLATSIKVYNLILDPKIILSDDGKYLDDTINALVDCFGYNKQELLNLVNENSQRSYYVYKKKLSYEDIAEFLEVKEAGEKYPNIQGVWFETEYERKYPFSSLACNVIGFTSSGNVGTWGIEEYYNSYLNGVDGRKYGYVNNDNIMQEVEKKADNGNTVVSTIDFNIQSIVERYIKECYEELKPEEIGIVIMDPNNGEILAMAGKQSYDLNNPRDLTPFYTNEELEAMTDEDKLKALNEIWRNYCISDSFEPGSTAKPFTIASALDENVIEASDEFLCDGYEIVGGWTIKCHKNEGHGVISLYQAIAYSCNDALMFIADKEGASLFTTYQRKFNFGMKTRVDLPGEESCANLLFSANDMGPADLATNSFGQNYNVTMVQMAASFSSLVNGGYYYTPHVVKEIINENGGIVESYDKTLVKQTVTNETSDIIKAGLRLCVDGGTGYTAGIDGYIISGKTGTAEKLPRGTGKYLLSFIGFAPYENPELVCYVVIDSPDTENQSTTYATKLWKAVMEEVLAYMNIFPDLEQEIVDEPETSEPETDENGNQLPQEESTEESTAVGDSEEVFENGIIEEEGEEQQTTGNEEGTTQWQEQTEQWEEETTPWQEEETQW